MLNKTIKFIVIVFLTAVLSGCHTNDVTDIPDIENGIYSVYYTNSSSTRLIAQNYAVEKQELFELVIELMSQLTQAPQDTDYNSAIPEGVTLLEARADNSILYLFFDSNYSEIASVEEILCRAAIVKTLTQIPGVEYVSFYVGDQPYIDAGGNLVDVMKASDFAENVGDVIKSYQRTSLTLYFTNEAGDKLVETNLTVVYTNNISMERLIVEQLIKGPDKEGVYPTLSDKVKLLGVSVSDNICYVEFDSAFLTELQYVNDYIPIYSIVNSLSELANVNKVQISVNGSKDVVFRDTISLNKAFERNLDYVGE